MERARISGDELVGGVSMDLKEHKVHYEWRRPAVMFASCGALHSTDHTRGSGATVALASLRYSKGLPNGLACWAYTVVPD